MTQGEAKSTDPWRVGVLFSRSGATDVTETEHFLGTALAVAEINRAGGILGREIEVIADDPRSDPQTYRRMADRFLTEEGLSVVFGCSSSAQRKAILSSIERRNGLLWYPSLYEGFEYSPNIVYTGATPNQNSFPLAEYLVATYGRRILLVGSEPDPKGRCARRGCVIHRFRGDRSGDLGCGRRSSRRSIGGRASAFRAI